MIRNRDVELRMADEADKDFLLTLRKLTMAEHLAAVGIALSDAEHRSRIDDDYDCARIVRYADQNVGLVKYRETADQLEIMQIQILPAYQGVGLGRLLMQSFVERARAKNIPVVLGVLKQNPARKLYERLGFGIVGEDEHEFHMRLESTGQPG